MGASYKGQRHYSKIHRPYVNATFGRFEAHNLAPKGFTAKLTDGLLCITFETMEDIHDAHTVLGMFLEKMHDTFDPKDRDLNRKI